MKKYFLVASAIAAISFSASDASADPLSYNGFNLDEMGLHKSAALPGEPMSSLLGITFNTGGRQVPSVLPPNSILFFPILSANWASTSYDASGNKIANSGGVSSNAEILRFVYVYPAMLQPSNSHYSLFSDIIIPAMVNVHANGAGNSGVGVGGSSVGDISWAPVSLFTTGFNGQNVTYSNVYDFVINFPAGSYSPSSAFNIGSNEYSFTFLTNPIFTFPKLNNLYAESQIHYTHVLRANNDFRVGGNEELTALLTGTPTSTYKTGDLFTINTDIAYPISPKVTIGPSFAVTDQLTNDHWNGKTVQNSGIFDMAAGVSMQYALTPFCFMRVKYLRSFSTRNMPQYNVVWADMAIPFRL